MTFEAALTLFITLPQEQQEVVVHVFESIKSAFPDIRDAFTQAMSDQVRAVEVETILSKEEKSR